MLPIAMLYKAVLAVLILAASSLLSIKYARYLNSIHDRYAPDHIDLTVVGGVAFIIATCGVLAAFEIIFTLPMVLLLGVVSVAWGIPILLWQKRQREERREQVEEYQRQTEES